MLPKPLVSVKWLVDHLHAPDLRILDCRFDLRDTPAGLRAYREGHVPGAVHVDLERDLSGPKREDGKGGRHPLPDPHVLARRLEQLGVGSAHRVVVYDDPRGGNGMFAARAWWLLRWLGHDDVSVLDGGWSAWTSGGAPTSQEEGNFPTARFAVQLRPELLADAEEVAALKSGTVLLDARAPARYRGEIEPLDRKAGHVPGAVNVDWSASLDETGHFRPADEQSSRFAHLGEGDLVAYCGSGVSACVNLLALELAGRPIGSAARLYAGSWSDWVSDESRPVAVGAEPSPLSSEPGMTTE